jgi:protein subunit release factor A
MTIWERQENETIKAYSAFCEYRDIGSERSQDKVSKKLGKSRQLLSRWASQYEWVKRVEAYEDHKRKIAEEAEAAEIRQTMSQGYALIHKRVKSLGRLATKLEKMINLEDEDDKTNLILDTKIGEVFNEGLVRRYQEVFNDIAKELGHRVVKTENKNDGSLFISGVVGFDPAEWVKLKQDQDSDDNAGTPK